MIQFTCGSCGSKLRAPVEKAGRSGKCPKCGHSFRIPSAPSGQGPSEPGPRIDEESGQDLDILAWLEGAAPTVAPPPQSAAPPSRPQQVSPADPTAPAGRARPHWGASAAPAISLRDIFRAPFGGDLAAVAVLQAGKILLMGIAIVVCAILAALLSGLGAVRVVILLLLVVLLASLSRTYVAVAEQYASGRVMATTDRSRLTCLGIFLLVALIGGGPLVLLMGAVVAAGAGTSSPGLLVLAGLWCILYLPLGMAMAAAEKTYNPLRVVMKAVQMWAGYLPVALYLVAFMGAAYVLRGLVHLVFSGLWLGFVGGLVGLTIAQYAFISGLGMTAMLLRKYKVSGGVSLREWPVAVGWIVGAIALGAAMVALRLAPFWTQDPITVAQHANRVKRIVRLAAQPDPKEKSRFGEAKPTRQDVAAAVARILPQRPHFLREYLLELVGEDTEHARRISATLARAIMDLPDGTDLTPLLEIEEKDDKQVYAAAQRVVANRAETDWLLEKSCGDTDRERSFAADVLAVRFPFRALDDAAVSRLAAPGSPAEKRKLYKRLLAETTAQYRHDLTGTYHFEITERLASLEGRGEVRTLGGAAAPVRLACRGETWEVTTGEGTWSGPLDALVRKRFTVTVPTGSLNFRVTVQCHKSGLSAEIDRPYTGPGSPSYHCEMVKAPPDP